MPRNNPTKTLGIERAWRRETAKRIRMLKARILDAYDEMITHQIVSNAEGDDFDIPEGARFDFMNKLTTFFTAYVGRDAPDFWGNRYQGDSYKRGDDVSMAHMYPPGIRPPSIFSDDPRILPNSQLDRRTLMALYNRSHDATDKWAADTLNRVGIIIEAPVLNPATIAEVRKEIIERVDVLQSRGNVIAQTETIQANQMASINTVTRENERLNDSIAQMFTDAEIKKLAGGGPDAVKEALGDAPGVELPFKSQSAQEKLRGFEVAQFEAGGFKLRWDSVADSRVRHLHRRFHGRLMTPEQARRNVQISPWNCRCGLLAENAADTTPKKNAQWRKERTELLEPD